MSALSARTNLALLMTCAFLASSTTLHGTAAEQSSADTDSIATPASDGARANDTASGGTTDQAAATSDEQPAAPAQKQKVAAANTPLKLKGGVSHDLTPFKEDGSVETIQQGTPLNITLSANLNSELAQVGDQICAMVSTDVKDKDKVLLPGQWYVKGKVTRVEKRKRAGMDGYVEIKFDKLCSPDGKHEVPFEASVSTKDSAPKAIVKHLVKDAGFVSVGAVGGALASVQLTGIPLAVATNGYSVAIGAAAGATIGGVAAIHRKGKIMSALPGDELKLKISKPVVLPAFNAEALPSAAPPEVMEGIDLAVTKWSKLPSPYGDKSSCLLQVSFKISNKTDRRFTLGDLAVVSNHNQKYNPFASQANIRETSKKVLPQTTVDGTITFDVGSPKHKYSLVLMDKGKTNVLVRVPIN